MLFEEASLAAAAMHADFDDISFVEQHIREAVALGQATANTAALSRALVCRCTLNVLQIICLLR